MMILLYAYLAGYAWFWRYHVGFIGQDFAGYLRTGTPREWDGDAFAFGLLLGTMACVLWPLTVTGRMIQVLWRKYGGDFDALGSIFPAPKEVETAAEKRERIAKEAEAHIKRRRAEINAHERENDLELTRWNN